MLQRGSNSHVSWLHGMLNFCISAISVHFVCVIYCTVWSSSLLNSYHVERFELENICMCCINTWKGQCHEIFCHFFISWIQAIWAPDKQAKIVLLISSFLRKNSQKIRLRAVLACAESDSTQANTARSRTLYRKGDIGGELQICTLCNLA